MKKLFYILAQNFEYDEFYVGKDLDTSSAEVEELNLDDGSKSNWLFETKEEAKETIKRFEDVKEDYVDKYQISFSIVDIDLEV